MRAFELEVNHAVFHLFEVKRKSLEKIDALEDVDRKLSVNRSL
jgi:hypothetical protein